MSKRILLLSATSILMLSACGGGWSDEQKEQLKNRCIGDGTYDCDCYVDGIIKAHEDPDTYNALSSADKDKLVEGCKVEAEAEEGTEENLESF